MEDQESKQRLLGNDVMDLEAPLDFSSQKHTTFKKKLLSFSSLCIFSISLLSNVYLLHEVKRQENAPCQSRFGRDNLWFVSDQKTEVHVQRV